MKEENNAHYDMISLYRSLDISLSTQTAIHHSRGFISQKYIEEISPQ